MSQEEDGYIVSGNRKIRSRALYRVCSAKKGFILATTISQDTDEDKNRMSFALCAQCKYRIMAAMVGNCEMLERQDYNQED